MAVQKSRKTPSRRGMRRSHDSLKARLCLLTQQLVKFTAATTLPPMVFIAVSKWLLMLLKSTKTKTRHSIREVERILPPNLAIPQS